MITLPEDIFDSVIVKFPKTSTILPDSKDCKESRIICYVSVTLCGMVMHGITVREQLEDKDVKVVYPSKKQTDGSYLDMFYPKDLIVRKQFEEKILIAVQSALIKNK